MQFDECSLPVLHFDEPALEFAYGQKTAHPKDGLFLYGPHGKGRKAKAIQIGIIGTPEGIEHFNHWAFQVLKRVEVPPPGKTEKQDRLHLATFPGMEEAFNVSFNPSEFVCYTVNYRKIDLATRILNLNEAVSKTVELYAERALHHKRNEELDVDVWILVLPEIIFERCRPEARRAGLPMVKGDFGKKHIAGWDSVK